MGRNSVHIPDKDMRSWNKLHYFTHNVFVGNRRNPYFESTQTRCLNNESLSIFSVHCTEGYKNQKKQKKLVGQREKDGRERMTTSLNKWHEDVKTLFCRWKGSLRARQNLFWPEGIFLFVCLKGVHVIDNVKGVFSTVFFFCIIHCNHETELSYELQKNVSINGLIWKSALNQ